MVSSEERAHWSGEHLVHDIDTFIGTNLGIDANMSCGRMVPHVTKRIDAAQPNFAPLEERYNFHNYVLEGRAAAQADE